MDPVTMFKAGTDGLSKLAEWIRQGGIEKKMPSLTAYGHQANVMGRVYIEDSIAQDDIAIPLMSILNQMYCCWIITALGIDSRCADGRSVRTRLQLVSGESFTEKLLNDIASDFGTEKSSKVRPSCEAKVIEMDLESQRLVCGRLIELDFLMQTVTTESSNNSGATQTTTYGQSVGTTSGTIDKNLIADNGKPVETGSTSSTLSRQNSVSTALSKNTMSGSKTTTMTGSLAKVYMYVQLVPYILKTEVAEQFMSLNFTPTLSQRIQQLRAGEISFIKDFLFAKDLIKKQSTALKKDNTGLVNEMLIRQRNSLFRWVAGLTNFLPERHNLANAILILDKQTFDRTCRDAHIDFDNYITRNKFFLKTFSMVMCVVDPMYGTMKMYFAGIPTVGTYSYTMINKVGSKGKDSFDLKEVMTAFSQGQAPRF